jgi:hypothetical protein
VPVGLPVALPEHWPWIDCERELEPDAPLFAAAPLTVKLFEVDDDDDDVAESMLLDFPVALSRSAAAWACVGCETALKPDALLLFAAPLTLKLLEINVDDVVGCMLLKFSVAIPEFAVAWTCVGCEKALKFDALLFAAPLTLKLSAVDDDVLVTVPARVFSLFVVVELRSTIFLKPS